MSILLSVPWCTLPILQGFFARLQYSNHPSQTPGTQTSYLSPCCFRTTPIAFSTDLPFFPA